MKKINYFLYLFTAFTLVFTSCNNEEAVVTEQQDKVAIEPEMIEGFEVEEEEVKNAIYSLNDGNQKSYYYCNYNFLKPSSLCKEDLDSLNCGTPTTLPILLNCNKKQVGELQVSNDDEYLYLTFEAASKRWYMNTIYLEIGDKNDIPFCSNGYPNLNKFDYRAYPYYYGGKKQAVYKIPLADINLDTFEVVAYAKMYDSYYGRHYSSFVYDSARTQKYYYSYYYGYYYGDWVRSFEYSKQNCQDDNCLNIFGRKFSDASVTCLTYNVNGNNYQGWSSWLPLRNILNSQGRIDIELFKENVDCGIDNVPYIGRLEIIDFDTETSEFTLAYFMYNNEIGGENSGAVNPYRISEVSLYVGTEANPFNEDGSYKPGITDANFYKSTYDNPTQRTENITLKWNSNTDPDTEIHIIPYAKVCKPE